MEKYLFGAIGGLLVVIAGIGLFAAVQHPSDAANLPQTAAAVVGEAASDAASAVTGTTNTPSQTQARDTDDDATSVSRNNDSDDDDDDDDSQRSTATTQTQTTSSSAANGTYTMAQVKTHNTESSCYTTIGGQVYDLTSFISQHPGGKRNIMKLCGIDGTALFNAQHGGQAQPEQELASLKIGTLTK